MFICVHLCGTEHGIEASFEQIERCQLKRRLWLRWCRRIAQRHSARCEKRGVRSSQECGVAELGTDGPARRSSLLSPAW